MSTRWKSLTSGTIKILRLEGDYLYIETEMPPDQKGLGNFTISELQKVGVGYYIGKTRRRVTGQDKHWDGPRSHACTLEFMIEINKVSPTRIEASAGDIGTDPRFDWDKCKPSKKPDVVPFVWIPE
jgi:hypothetical protein